MNFICKILKIDFFNITYSRTMDIYNTFSSILEYVPNPIISFDNLKHENLYKIINDFIIINNISYILISLSGGVDSMVLFEIINYIKLNEIKDLIIL